MRLVEDKARVLAFLVPMIVRAIPEVLSWPYPIGFDTIVYAGYAVSETFVRMPILHVFKTTSLLYIIYTLLYKALGDPLLPAKLLGPLLTGLVGFTIYLYGRAAGYKPGASLLASLLATTCFVGLRISWEMYRQMLGTVFLFLIFYLETRPQTKMNRLGQAVLSFLTAWSHEFITVILLSHKAIQSLGKRHQFKIIEEALPAVPAGLLFVYQIYSPSTGALQVPVLQVASPTPLHLFLYITGFVLYLYLPLAPLIVFGIGELGKPQLRDFAFVCLLLTYLPLLSMGILDILWFRWTILIVYPVAFMAAGGFERLMNGEAPLSRETARRLAVATLVLNVVFTATYLVLPPEGQFNKYFGDWNIYKHFIQTSMLQSCIPLRDIPPTIEAIKWVDSLPGNKTLVLHEAFHNWAQIYAKSTRLVRINEQKLSSPIRQNISQLLVALAEKQNTTVYTIWWTNTTWYNMAQPPPQYKPIKTFQDIAVFIYNP